MRCRYCRAYFARFRCNKPGECDCPPCQGYCECRLERLVEAIRDESRRLVQKEVQG